MKEGRHATLSGLALGFPESGNQAYLRGWG